MPIDSRNTENICPTCNHACHCQLNNPQSDTRKINQAHEWSDHHGKCGVNMIHPGKVFWVHNEGYDDIDPNWEDELCGCASCGCPAA